eukprot:SAG11_NODE_21_length_25065_cov_3.589081_23_plen_524_part_00
MPFTLGHVITCAQMIIDVLEIALRNRDGTPWADTGRRATIATIVRMYEATKRAINDAPLTFKEFLSPATIESYCDGVIERPRDVGSRDISSENHTVTVGEGSIAKIADVCMKMMKVIDPDANIGLLETLHAKASDADRERREEAMQSIPPYSHFKQIAGREGMALMQAPDTLSLAAMSKLTYLTSQIILCATREKVLLHVRGASVDDFDPTTDHGEAAYDALMAEHGSDFSMVTMLYDSEGQAVRLVLGVHGITDPRKNTFFHKVDFTDGAILPEAEALMPLVRAGWAGLYKDYTDGNFLLRSGGGESLYGRNWARPHFKTFTGHTVGHLRKATETRAFQLHLQDPDGFPLEKCLEVSNRLQHRPATALKNYVNKRIRDLQGTMSSDDDFDDSGHNDDADGAPEVITTDDAGDDAGDDAVPQKARSSSRLITRPHLAPCPSLLPATTSRSWFASAPRQAVRFVTTRFTSPSFNPHGTGGHLLVVGFNGTGNQCPPCFWIRHLDTLIGCSRLINAPELRLHRQP